MRKINKIFLPILLLVGCISPEVSNTATATLSPEPSISGPLVAATETINLDDYYLSAAAQENYETLLLSNGGCELPCLWGFMVGETTWLETKTAMEKIHKIYEPENFYQDASWPIHGIALQFIDPDYGAVLSPLDVTVDESGIVQRLSLYVETDSGNALHHFWSYYSLRNIFAELGPPSRVFISVTANDPRYEFLAFYDQEKIAVWLAGERKSGAIICPLDRPDGEVDHLQLSIANPKSQLGIFPIDWEFWFGTDDKNYQGEYLDTAAAFGISTEEFYQKVLFDQVDCFDVLVSPK